MTYQLIVSDWNGTIPKHPTDEILNKEIAYALLDDAKSKIITGNLLALRDILQLHLAKNEITKQLKAYSRGNVYKSFSRRVLRGKDYEFVSNVINQYVSECVENNDVDTRILRTINLARKCGIKTGILSVSIRHVICRTLIQLNLGDLFETIVSNSFVTRNIDNELKILGCSFDIYNRKPECLENRFLKPYQLRDKDVIYFGDSEDDLGIAEMLPKGNFIVPFFATDTFRQYAAAKFGAFVPDTEKDPNQHILAR